MRPRCDVLGPIDRDGRCLYEEGHSCYHSYCYARDPVEVEVDEMFCTAATHGPRNSTCTCERD